MHSNLHSPFRRPVGLGLPGRFRTPLGAASIDPAIISSAITAAGSIATSAISATDSKKKKSGKKKKGVEADQAAVVVAPPPAASDFPSWVTWLAVGVVVLVGGYVLLKKRPAAALVNA